MYFMKPKREFNFTFALDGEILIISFLKRERKSSELILLPKVMKNLEVKKYSCQSC